MRNRNTTLSVILDSKYLTMGHAHGRDDASRGILKDMPQIASKGLELDASRIMYFNQSAPRT